MPDVVFSGPDGRIEGRYHPAAEPNAPIAIVLHPHPKLRGTMHHPVVYHVFQAFVARGCSVLRFNFRGAGRSEGTHDNGQGELTDAAAALDWLQNMHPEHGPCWVAGYSFGAWIGMQLLMRRPEVNGFVSVSPPTNFFDFSFLAPCPTSGLIVSGGRDTVVPLTHINKLVKQLKTQKNTVIEHVTIRDGNHFYARQTDELYDTVYRYLGRKLAHLGQGDADRENPEIIPADDIHSLGDGRNGAVVSPAG